MKESRHTGVVECRNARNDEAVVRKQNTRHVEHDGKHGDAAVVAHVQHPREVV